MNYLPIALLLVGGIILTVGDIVMKKWAINQKVSLYLIGLFFYLIGLNFLAQSYRFRNVAAASLIFVVINITILVFVSWFYFKEKLSLMEILGIVLAIAGVIILEVFRK